MNSPNVSIQYGESRNRATSAFRIFLAIPHFLVLGAWGSLAQTLGFLQWWFILFTGKRNSGLWNMQNSWLGYELRAYGYICLLFDKWPAFGDLPQGEPTSYDFLYDQKADRTSSFFRLIMLVPALIVFLVLFIASVFVLLASWFAILFTGKQPRGCFDFILKTLRYWLSLEAYGLLMTDAYPKTK
ncbi:MAG: DUF4389 domain-containing protein [Ilumatobacteraceae bacterium]